MKLVLDASALVSWVSDGSASDLDELIDPRIHDLAVPTLCDAETVGGLSRQVRLGLMEASDAADALIDYVSMPVERHHHVRHVGRMWQLRNNFTAADATYIALAESLEATLVTTDVALADAVRRHTAVPVVP